MTSIISNLEMDILSRTILDYRQILTGQKKTVKEITAELENPEGKEYNYGNLTHRETLLNELNLIVTHAMEKANTLKDMLWIVRGEHRPYQGERLQEMAYRCYMTHDIGNLIKNLEIALNEYSYCLKAWAGKECDHDKYFV